MFKKELTPSLIAEKMVKKTQSAGGFTLIEIVVAAVILALVITGLANIFVAGKRWVLHSNMRMAGGELGRYFLDPLQMQVRQDTWGASCLGTGNCPGQTVGVAEGFDTDYTASYSVTTDYQGTSLSKVVARVTWTERE